ncbi:hypothetical protein ACIODT_06560 [Streptomyces sp. NPDC088251]|uniref:hypothetical protein n=1 Tax=unclassified Streptomyces TaxID=2593676 RepID=UPI0038143A9B
MLISDSFGHSDAQRAAPGPARDAEHDASHAGPRDTPGTRDTCAAGTREAGPRAPERDEVRSGLVPYRARVGVASSVRGTHRTLITRTPEYTQYTSCTHQDRRST